jgi:glucose uptake protein GlcU
MRIDWESVPTWPLYIALYVAMGFVVSESLVRESARQCEASSALSTRLKLVSGAIWPVTASFMMASRMDPMAALRRRNASQH